MAIQFKIDSHCAAEDERLTDEEFQKLALLELDAVYRLACHLARNSVEAEDFVQETFLRAFRSSQTFKLGEYGIRPWLFKILHNVIHTHAAQHLRERSTIAGLQQEMQSRSDHHSTPIVDCSSLDWDRVDARLKSAVADLPMPYRIAFLLSALEGLKYREIAEVTEVPVGTVMSRLSRARAMLATKLATMGSDYGYEKESKQDPK